MLTPIFIDMESSLAIFLVALMIYIYIYETSHHITQMMIYFSNY
jgi:hypothetical protein